MHVVLLPCHSTVTILDQPRPILLEPSVTLSSWDVALWPMAVLPASQSLFWHHTWIQHLHSTDRNDLISRSVPHQKYSFWTLLPCRCFQQHSVCLS